MGARIETGRTNVEPAQAAREDVLQAMQAILSELASRAKYGLGDDFVDRHWTQILNQRGGYAALGETLTQWAANTVGGPGPGSGRAEQY